MAQGIIATFAERDPARQVTCSIADGLTANADARLLAIVLENLLGNAWKFTAKRERATISLSYERRVEGGVYMVRDNGAGFDMAYAGRLFAPFQRLHRESEFSGSGIGLATVQRVISRHGGRIWAESSPGSGAVFSFTLGGDI